MGMLVGGLAFSGAGAVLHGHPQHRVGYTVPFWVNATLLAIFATLVLGRLGSPQAWAIGLVVTGVLLWVTILSEYHLVMQTDSRKAILSGWWSQAMSYVLLLGFALLIFLSPLQIGWRIVLLTLISAACSASILRNHTSTRQKYRAIGGVTVLITAQFSGLIAVLPLQPVQQALVIFLAFYVLVGMAGAGLTRGFSRRIAVEYAVIILIGLLAISKMG